jgi:hypothetical protein
MALLRRLALPAVLTALAVAPGTAAAHGRQICVPVRATGVGQDLGGGQTTATISSHGVRLGTTNASFTTTGGSGTVASFAGPIKFTSPAGTLTAQVVGSLDIATGAGVFRATSTSVTGTGLLRGVTGSLTFAGTENLTTGAFTETITGELCYSSAPASAR